VPLELDGPHVKVKVVKKAGQLVSEQIDSPEPSSPFFQAGASVCRCQFGRTERQGQIYQWEQVIMANPWTAVHYD
jgi:hypothetical protein